MGAVSLTLRHAIALLAFVALATAIYFPVLGLRPLRGDNLYVLAWVHQAPFNTLLEVDPTFYPEWRPLAYLSIWLEYQLFALSGVPFYLFVNIVLWAVCAWLVYLIILQLTAVRLAAAGASLWLLFDRRAIESLTLIVERQTTLACAFGLLAILVMARAKYRVATPGEAILIGLALFLSPLAKEYGMAFAIAAIGYGVVRRQWRIVTASAAAVAMYVVFRGTAAGFGLHGYCEEMGYFNAIETHCFDPATPIAIRQVIYNTGASIVGTLLPGLLGDEGAFAMSRAQILRGGGMLILAGIGLWLGGPVVRMLAVIPIVNGLLGFAIFRHRNLLVGVCAVAILAGIGLARSSRRTPPAYVRVAGVSLAAFVSAVILVRVAHAHLTAREIASLTGVDEPCDSSIRERTFGDPFVRLVKNHYGMPNADCR